MADALQALVIRPGDHLVIRVDPRAEQDDIDRLKTAVEDRLPGVKAMVLGVEQIAAYRPEPAHG